MFAMVSGLSKIFNKFFNLFRFFDFKFKNYFSLKFFCFLKKSLSLVISYTLIYSQITFTFFITQSIISIVSTNNAYAFNEIIPPQNIKDNPINHIEIDNSVNIPNNNDNRNNGNNAYLDRAQNGTPMVNINNANDQGISANYYKDFNVNQENLILNNHKGESVNTQLGGVIYGNPNFNIKDNNGNNVGREADIILNEITTSRVSNINGYIEVAGKKADVIIANPNGLMVGGAGFINTSRLSMITGRSLNQNGTSFDSNGNLNPFLLTDTNQNPNAIIQVVGQNVFDKNGNPVAYNLGIDAKDVKYADLISRIVKLNGNIAGSDDTEVSIKTGNDKAYYNRDKDGNANTNGFNVVSKDNSNNSNNTNKPEFAIDSTAFGGIYAGRIKFIATEDGVGVRTRSDLVASVDDIDFDVNGNIIFEEEGSLQAKRNINLDNVNNTNNNPNKTNANSQNNRKIINKSKIVAENDINIKTNSIKNTNISSTKTTINQETREITTETLPTPTQTSLIFAKNNINLNAISIENNDTSNNTNSNTGNNNQEQTSYYGVVAQNGTLTINTNILNNENGNISGKNVSLNIVNNEFILGQSQQANQQNSIQLQNNNNNNQPQYSLQNTGGNIISTNDITLNILTDYIITGTIFSSNGNITINAKNITNNSDVISANDIIFNAIGNIINGSESNLATIIAMNDMILNSSKDMTNIINELLNSGISQTELDTKTQDQLIALCKANTSCNQNQLKNKNSQYNTTGNLYNYGKISANNDLTINAEDSIYNGLTNKSKATISGNNSVNLIANRRLINKAFIQAVGKTDSNGNKIENTGKLNITTNAKINSDYKLNENSTTSEDLDIKIDATISAEAQAKLDNIDNINDMNELLELLKEIKTSQQYYKVQDRIVIVKIKEEIKDLQEIFTFNVDDWKIGNTITIYEEDPNDPDNDIERQVPLTETLFQEMLSSALGNNYVESDWDISNKVAKIESEADTKIAQQQARFEEYNNTEKAKAEEEYKENNNGSLEGFNWVDYTMEQYINNNPTIETEGLLVKEELIQAPLNQVYQERLTKLETKFTEEKSKADTASLINWDNINKTNIHPLLKELLTKNYDYNDWSYKDFDDGSNGVINDKLRAYILNLRLNEKELNSQATKNKTEKTGIHNYGRLYSNNDMTLNSNSVLHNNKGALIYSNNDINLNVNDTIFNNENNIGQGIFANNNINIKGFTDGNNSKVRNLINYDGRIEANKNINIKANSVLNYGSDKIDVRVNPYAATGQEEYFYRYPGTNETKMYKLITYHSILESNSSYIQSNHGDIDIETNNNLVNVNSDIYGNNIKIISPVIVNTKTEFYVQRLEYWQWKEKRKHKAKKSTYRYHNWQETYNLLLSTSTSSRIVAKGNLTLASDNITNGSITESNTTYAPKGSNIPYLPNTIPTSTIDNIINSGTLNPLTLITLPQGNYGIFRKPADPNSIYLFETDPTLVDTTKFLGSIYFMNRLGLDPYTIDLKFLGDAYIEFELLKRSIEQTSLMQNIHYDSEEIAKQLQEMRQATTKELADRLGLEVGKELTQEQMDNLEEDIIWYVEQSIELPSGEIYKALVPQIYYCKSSLQKMEQQRIANTTYTLIAGDSITIRELNSGKTTESVLNNSGTITANNTLIIDGVDKVNNITIGIKEEIPDVPVVVINDEYRKILKGNNNNNNILNNTLLATPLYKTIYKEVESNNNNYQATLSAGNTLIINSGENGVLNNLSGLITLDSSLRAERSNPVNNNTNNTNNNTGNTSTPNPYTPSPQGGRRDGAGTSSSSLYDNLLYINTGTINNITISQQETIEHKEKNYEFEKTTTNIGATATISSNNTNSNIILNADKDINIMGADILAKEDNSNITLNAGNDINISTIQDYEYQRQYSKQKSGALGTTKTTREDITASLTNIKSNITASNNLSITTGNDLTSIGTNFTATNGNMDFDIGNDLNLYNAMDYNYEYHYLKKEKFDLGGALLSTLGANAFGGPIGMAVNAKNIGNMKTGKVDITENYDETIIGNTLNAKGGINLSANNNATLTSVNLNSGNNINILAGNQVLINTAVENDYSKETHEKYRSDLWGAFVGGAAVGIASAIGTPVAGLYATDLTKDTNQKVNISEKSVETSTNIASNINSDSNINISADKGNLISISSNIKTEDGDITLQSNNGDVMLGSATDTKKEYSREYSKGFGQAYAKFDRQAEAGVQFNEEETIKTTTTNTASVNNLEANNGNLTINSKGSIISVGSQIYADNNINLKATDGNILLTSANNSETTETQHDKTTISTGVKVGNAYVDTGYAAKDLNDARKAVEKAKDELDRIKKLRDEGKASDSAVKDAEANVAMASVNLANATIAFASSVAGAATSTPTAGFYASAFVNAETTSEKTHEQSTWQTQGNLMSGRGNINFTSGNNMTQEGTNTYASNSNGTGTINYDIANDLNILASKDTYSMTSETETKNAGGSVGNNAVQLNYGQSESNSRIFSTTYNNVDIIANNINIKTGNNTDIKGANVLAQATIDNSDNTIGGNINMDIGNNLNIESLQDSYYAKSKSSSFGISAGGGKGKDGISGNAGFNIGKTNSTTDSQWVNEQTSIIGNNSVNIKVGSKEGAEGNTNIKGAVIASGKYKEVELPESEWKVDINTGETIKTKIVFEDNGNLNLATNTLTYQDLNDFYREETKGYNFGTSVGGNTDKGKANMAPNGSTTIGLTHTGQEKEQITRATIGNGNITIGNNTQANDSELLAGLNRNVDKSQEITKDIITGALNASVTIDNRLLLGFMNAGKEVVKDKDGKPIQKGVDKDGNPIYETRDINGFQSIGSDFRNFGDNFTGALVGATGSVINTIKTTYDTITDSNSSITDVAKNWKTGQNSLATSIMRGTDDKTKDIMEKINKGTATPEELQYVSNMVSKDGDGNIIFTSDGKSIIVKDADGRIGEQLGFNDKTTGQGYVDAGKTATDAKTFMKVDAEERIHKNIESESVAKNMANREVGYYNTISFLTGGKGLAVSNTTNGGLNSQMQSNWNQQYNTSTSSLLANNTSIASNVNDKLYSVFVDEKGKILKVTDNNNYNAYLVGKGITREDIEKDPEKYENENNIIPYSELFLKDEKLSGENLTLAEQSLNNPEVHNELLLLDSFDKNKSISENITDLLKSGAINGQTASNLQRAVGNGADDNKLLYNLNPNLYSAFDSLNVQSNPMLTLSNSFGLELNNQTFISATGTEPRGCDNAGCGYFGAPRFNSSTQTRYPHAGLDLSAEQGSMVFAPQDGVITRINDVYTKNNGSLVGITINSNKGESKLYYVEPKDYINVGTNVNQGDILGNSQDLATGSPKKHGGSNPTPNHVHQQLKIGGKLENPANHINNN